MPLLPTLYVCENVELGGLTDHLVEATEDPDGEFPLCLVVIQGDPLQTLPHAVRVSQARIAAVLPMLSNEWARVLKA